MRKLTVKNFSVIKEAELEFGKITVLIGPQASGKSLLCKLAYFMGRVVLEIAIDHVVRLTDFSEFATAAQREFTKWFPQEGWGERNWSIEFRAGAFAVSIFEFATSESTSGAGLTFCEEFKAEYRTRLEETLQDQRQRGFVIAPALRSIAATRFMKLAGRGVWDAATYIPSERSFFVDMQRGYRALAADADRVSAQFAVAFADSMNREIPKPRLKSFLGGDIVYSPDGPSVSFSDGRLLPINFLSSGSKEMLAILAVLDLYEYRRRSSGSDWLSQELDGDRLYVFDELTIEEPEASVFPQSQFAFVQEIAALSNESGFQPHFTITTHSPYILSGFNDLIEAGRLGAETALSKEVNEIIPEKYWVKPGDFKAYSIHDGKLQSIMDKETGLINGEYLDAISNKIGGDFDALLRIGYAKS